MNRSSVAASMAAIARHTAGPPRAPPLSAPARATGRAAAPSRRCRRSSSGNRPASRRAMCRSTPGLAAARAPRPPARAARDGSERDRTAARRGCARAARAGRGGHTSQAPLQCDQPGLDLDVSEQLGHLGQDEHEPGGIAGRDLATLGRPVDPRHLAPHQLGPIEPGLPRRGDVAVASAFSATGAYQTRHLRRQDLAGRAAGDRPRRGLGPRQRHAVHRHQPQGHAALAVRGGLLRPRPSREFDQGAQAAPRQCTGGAARP